MHTKPTKIVDFNIFTTITRLKKSTFFDHNYKLNFIFLDLSNN
jgi:hypothetical protein